AVITSKVFWCATQADQAAEHLDYPLGDLSGNFLPVRTRDSGLFERVEDLAVEEFVAQASIEALDVAILPWASGCDVGSLRPDGGDPVLHGRGDELRAVVGTDVLRHAAQDEQVGQDVDDVGGVELAIDADRQ